MPCHRIIGSGGRAKLTGYGGGMWRKEWLLRRAGGVAGVDTRGGQAHLWRLQQFKVFSNNIRSKEEVKHDIADWLPMALQPSYDGQ